MKTIIKLKGNEEIVIDGNSLVISRPEQKENTTTENSDVRKKLIGKNITL